MAGGARSAFGSRGRLAAGSRWDQSACRNVQPLFVASRFQGWRRCVDKNGITVVYKRFPIPDPLGRGSVPVHAGRKYGFPQDILHALVGVKDGKVARVRVEKGDNPTFTWDPHGFFNIHTRERFR